MKSSVRPLLAVGLSAMTALPLAGQPATGGREKFHPAELLSGRRVPIAGVWYTAFYGLKAGDTRHWEDVKTSKHPLPVGGVYDCSDAATIQRQVAVMRDVGITFLVFDHTNTVGADNGQIDRRIRAWFDYMDRQPADRRLLLAIAAGGELNQHGNRESWRKAVDQLWKTYALRPSYARLHGKPLFLWYIEKDVWPEWRDERWTVRPTLHWSRTAGQRDNGGWGWGSVPEPPGNFECMSFLPGWHRADDKGPGVPRGHGEHYGRCWLKVEKQPPLFVLIAGWNDWSELTALEDSPGWQDPSGRTTPDYYTRMTKGHIAAGQGRLLEGFVYAFENVPGHHLWKNQRWQTAAPSPPGAPSILVPREWQTQVNPSPTAVTAAAGREGWKPDAGQWCQAGDTWFAAADPRGEGAKILRREAPGRDFTAEVDFLKTVADSSMGFCFRYRDVKNGYMLDYSGKRPALKKIADGKVSVLGQVNDEFAPGRWCRFTLVVRGEEFSLSYTNAGSDSPSLLNVRDREFPQGQIALRADAGGMEAKFRLLIRK